MKVVGIVTRFCFVEIKIDYSEAFAQYTGMKIIFLDIDGVLNNRATSVKNSHGCIGLDYHLVKIFRRIVKETGAKIVMSSTWRLYKDLMEDVKKALGPDIEIIGQTKDIWSGDRGDEIQEWLNNNQSVCEFAIIDDNDDMAHLADSPNFFQTTSREGLTDEIADNVIRFLNKSLVDI